MERRRCSLICTDPDGPWHGQSSSIDFQHSDNDLRHEGADVPIVLVVRKGGQVPHVDHRDVEVA